MLWLPNIVMLAAISISVVTDVRDGKIYNAVTAPAAALGIVANVLAHWSAGHPLAGLAESLLGIGAGLGIFFLSALAGRLLGGGDVKLLMVIGACNGPVFLAWTVLFMALAGGLIAIIVSLWRGELLGSFSRLWHALCMRAFASAPMDACDGSSTARLPYAIPIAIGGVVALCVYQISALGIQFTF